MVVTQGTNRVFAPLILTVTPPARSANSLRPIAASVIGPLVFTNTCC